MKKISIRTFFVTKLLITIILTLIILILIKSSSSFKNRFYKHIYGTNMSFTQIKNLYDKYIGDFDMLNNVVKTEEVFNEKLTYKNKEKYLDGVSLSIESNYLIPIEESGIVVFIGNKEG